MLTLIDFVGRGDYRFSPYTWRTKLAMAQLGLEYATRDVSFLDKTALEEVTDYRQAPVLLHGDKVITDSWAIALYLDHQFPNGRPLFADDGRMALASFLNSWTPRVLYPALLSMIAVDVVTKLRENEQKHYRISRENRLGQSLEAAAENRPALAQLFSDHLEPVRTVLAEDPYLNGQTPGYGDYILAALFLWLRSTSPYQPLTASDPICAWRDRLFDAYSPLINCTPGHDGMSNSCILSEN